MVVGTQENNEEKMLTDDEAALYDRQLRLWGVEAQKRLISSKLLVIGMTGLGAEICKNIILGGVKSVTLMDSSIVTEADVLTQFFLPKDSVGQNRAEASVANAQKLNPMVSVMAESGNVDDKPDSFYQDFTLIVTIGCTRKQVLRLNRLARLHGVAFFAADVFGFSSYLFSDLGEHQYKKEVITAATKTTPEVIKVIDGILRYVPFQDILNLDWNMEELAKRVKKTNPSFFALFVILEFIELHNRRPDPSKRDSDYQELLKCRDAFADRQGVSKEKIPDEYFENVFGELPPVAAITGGVIAQEVVKAISHKDIPLMNLFVYSSVAGTGYVENFAMNLDRRFQRPKYFNRILVEGNTMVVTANIFGFGRHWIKPFTIMSIAVAINAWLQKDEDERASTFRDRSQLYGNPNRQEPKNPPSW